MRETFTVNITVDRETLRVSMETVYQSGNRISHPPSSHSSREILNEFLVLFIQSQSASFGERCIHLVKFAPVEEAVNAN